MLQQETRECPKEPKATSPALAFRTYTQTQRHRPAVRWIGSLGGLGSFQPLQQGCGVLPNSDSTFLYGMQTMETDAKLTLYNLKFWSLPSSNNLMLFLPWDIVNIRKLNRNIVTSPSPICPCCMSNEKEKSLSIIVIRTKRPYFIAFILTQWFSSLFILQVILNGVHKLPPPTTPRFPCTISVTYW